MLEYDVVLKHRAGKLMVVADALSRQCDWAEGVENDNKGIVAIPEELFVQAVDQALQDAVEVAQQTDELAQDALKGLTELTDAPTKWTVITGVFSEGCFL